MKIYSGVHEYSVQRVYSKVGLPLSKTPEARRGYAYGSEKLCLCGST